MVFLSFRDRSKLVLFRWSAVGAGLCVALGLHIVASALGLGIAYAGAGSIAEGSTGYLVLAWSGAAWLAAAFVGGYVAAWVADSSSYVESIFHGLTLWGLLTVVLMVLPPTAMSLGGMLAETVPPSEIVSFVAWFVAIGGLLSLGTTIWGSIVGSRVVESVEAKMTEGYRAA
ncbi:MAG TPA: hypothetical protein PKA61_00125 [Nitrospira sp.]|nr:hypothetical protein [Nitrospira sp.]